MQSLELVEVNPDPIKSEVMTRAAELRDEGYDHSTALEQAWAETTDAWDDWEGWEDEDEDDELLPDELIPQSIKKTTRRKNMSENPAAGGTVGMMLIAGVVAYFIWCAIKKTWTPWKVASVSRQLTAARPPIVKRIGSNNSYREDFTREDVRIITP